MLLDTALGVKMGNHQEEQSGRLASAHRMGEHRSIHSFRLLDTLRLSLTAGVHTWTWGQCHDRSKAWIGET